MHLKNNYFGMRHGRSLANEQGVIVSDPASGCLETFGLSELGRQQVKAAVHASVLSPETLIFSSDFSRTRQTAEIVQELIGAGKITFTPLLRERYFGDWEKTPASNYEKIWQNDQIMADSQQHNVESSQHVWMRVAKLVKMIEQAHYGRNILLVSHGDTLQILQAGLNGIALTKHHDLPHLETAEIRKLS